MATGLARAMAATDGVQAGVVWARARAALAAEMGRAQFDSWLDKAVLHEDARGGLTLVAHTGMARDWLLRHAWRRVEGVWSSLDPAHRPLLLKSRSQFEAEGAPSSPVAPATTEVGVEAALARAVTMADPVSTDLPDAAPLPHAVSPSRPAGLQERLRFDSFVAGQGNDFAHGVARKVASWSDAGLFNPVVFHGPFGWGKTHLLNAIAWEAMRADPDRKVIYLSAERFLAGFMRALQDKRTAAFKEELRSADLLLIDDIHFVAGKERTQEEMLSTLTALVEDGRRVVLTADRAPGLLTDVDARLRSHLQSGLTCTVEAADWPLRLAILERKLEVMALQVGCDPVARPEVIKFVADRFGDSGREMEGALKTLVAAAGRRLGALSVDEAQSVLRAQLKGGDRRVTVDEIQKVTAEYYGLSKDDLTGERRQRAIARPRQVAMWLCKQLTVRSLPDIGRRFGGRDHTTVLHAVRRIDELKAGDAQLARDVDGLIRKLRG